MTDERTYLMTGKTHLAIGAAAAVCLLHPASPREWVISTAAAAVGSVICDVDVSTSNSHEKTEPDQRPYGAGSGGGMLPGIPLPSGHTGTFQPGKQLVSPLLRLPHPAGRLYLRKKPAPPVLYAFHSLLAAFKRSGILHVSGADARIFRRDAVPHCGGSFKPQESTPSLSAEMGALL